MTGLTFHIEHVIPRTQGGLNDIENLALACPFSNYRKSDRVAGIDPETKKQVRLFNPRLDKWKDHFKWSQNRLKAVGKTAIGRATIEILGLNEPEQQAFRRLWKERFQDLFPFD